MNKNTLIIFAVAITLTACSTPRTVLVNPETGQVATCGGSATGSMAGGIIGYHIEKSNASECVAEYMDLGFKRRNSPNMSYPAKDTDE